MSYPLSDIAKGTAANIGIELSTPNPPTDLYDNLMRMGFARISPILLQASTELGPMRDELTLVGKGSGNELLHCYSGKADETGLLYAQRGKRVVLVVQGIPTGMVVVETVDTDDGTIHRLMHPYVSRGEAVISHNGDSTAPFSAMEGLEKVLSALLIK